MNVEVCAADAASFDFDLRCLAVSGRHPENNGILQSLVKF